jgi:hypothetical protein
VAKISIQHNQPKPTYPRLDTIHLTVGIHLFTDSDNQIFYVVKNKQGNHYISYSLEDALYQRASPTERHRWHGRYIKELEVIVK